jgi:hypothetical protein
MQESASIFTQVIQDHLELKRRNADLEGNMPLGRYKSEDPFENHPLFKTEEQARLDETMDGQESLPGTPAQGWPGEDTQEHSISQTDEGLWGRSRDFDWGD